MQIVRYRATTAEVPECDFEQQVLLARGALSAERAAGFTKRVLASRRSWTKDFGGDQFSLGRAFYTHYETERAKLYFDQAERSDAAVEARLPGMQSWMRDLFSTMARAQVRPRPGFCSAGAHIFEPGGLVARKGGVVHFDVEGLSPLHLARKARSLSLVVMLQPPTWGGGLRLYDAMYAGSEEPSDAQRTAPTQTIAYAAGDALLMSSFRLHQIRPFRGERARISLTLHGVEVDRGLFETWF
jgi:hypothetical protein